ncbi:MAG: homogentisate 1,2-dioxygenase, partial [Acidobacteria bacterium]|nr:homogentisate 1,2-dioxygenase [Acidobacteriota bacterium]
MTPTKSKKQFKYQSGFGNEFATEAIEGALPVGQNSP